MCCILDYLAHIYKKITTNIMNVEMYNDHALVFFYNKICVGGNPRS